MNAINVHIVREVRYLRPSSEIENLFFIFEKTLLGDLTLGPPEGNDQRFLLESPGVCMPTCAPRASISLRSANDELGLESESREALGFDVRNNMDMGRRIEELGSALDRIVSLRRGSEAERSR